MISLKAAKRVALTTFILGTVLFLLQIIFGEKAGIIGLGLLFILVAFILNSILFLVALINLIKTDQLESFFVMCILLINLPVAAGYTYFILERF